MEGGRKMNITGIYAPYIRQYIELKRHLGFKLRDAEYIFGQFAQLAREREETSVGISKELSDAWCRKHPNESDGTRNVRVSHISLFARFLCDTGLPSYISEVPKRSKDFVPYIFPREEMIAIFKACDSLRITRRGSDTAYAIMPTLVRLLYGTGMRLGEALNLREKDVNLAENCITVRESKNGTDRIVPITESLSEVCRCYLDRKRMRIRAGVSDIFFVKSDNSVCFQGTAYQNFRRILWQAGIPHMGKGLGPRLHDLRHTFACHSLAAMEESGLDIYHSMPVLSTYLGHRTLESTDKYVRLTAEMYPKLIKGANDTCSYVYPSAEEEDV
jgi:integrase/recombinase XerD